MERNSIRRNMPLFPISIVMKLTDLSARQIRYYEEHELVAPARSEGNKRIFSLNDIDRLLEIKEMLEQGVNLAGIKKVLSMKGEPVIPEAVSLETNEKAKRDLTDEELRKLLRAELLHNKNYSSLRQGDMSRFFH